MTKRIHFFLIFLFLFHLLEVANAATIDEKKSEDFSQIDNSSGIKVLFLIVSSDDLPVFAELEKVWRSYMKLDPEHVEAYFIKSNPNLATSCELIGDTLWAKTSECFCPGMTLKTLLAMEYMLPRLNEFDYVVRTNLSSFYIFPRLFEFLKTLPKTECYAAHIDYGDYPNCCSSWGCGAGIYLSPDLVEKFVKNKENIFNDPFLYYYYDDVFISYFFQTKNNIKLISAPRTEYIGTKNDWLMNKPVFPEDAFHFRVKNSNPALRLANDPYILLQFVKMHYPSALLPDLEGSSSMFESKLKEDPDNEKLIFQLALAYESEGNLTEAIKCFKSRIEKERGQDEVWGSMYKIAEIYNTMGDWDQAFHWYLKTYEKFPDRAEPLHKIAQHYRNAGQNNLAYNYANQGKKIPRPPENSLFFLQSVYDYELDEELSIAAFYTSFKEEGRMATDRLIFNRNIPVNLKDQSYRNMVFYSPLLNAAKIEEGSTVAIESLLPLKGPNDGRCEKKCLTVNKDGQLHIIYGFDPYIIYKIDPATGKNGVVLFEKPTYDFSHFRGSAGPIEFDHGYLLAVHEVVPYGDHIYHMHRFVQLDKDLKMTHVSLPFFFEQKGVEYCCGMTIDQSGENLIMAISVEDREAHLLTTDLKTVKELLRPLP